MAHRLTCDMCGTEITRANPVVAKLFITPVLPGKTVSHHSEYTGSQDVGKCCFSAALKIGTWQRRRSRTDSHNRKRLRPEDDNDALRTPLAADPVETRRKRKTRVA